MNMSSSTVIFDQQSTSAPIQPLHNPAQAAKVSVPQAPLGNANANMNRNPDMGMKALLAKKMAKNKNPKFISPTDNLMTPVSQKLNAQKQKHFLNAKNVKPMQTLFQKDSGDEDDEENVDLISSLSPTSPATVAPTFDAMDQDENPF